MVKINIILTCLAGVLFWGCPEFDSYGDSSPNIFTVNVDGTGEVQITDSDWGNKNSPYFADGGNKIVYWGDDENYHQSVYVMDADGKNQRKITSGRYSTVSPDGQWIIYADYDGTVTVNGISYYAGLNLYKSNLDGSSITRLTEAIYTDTLSERCRNGSFSYDNQYVVYNYERTVNREVEERAVYMMMVDGTNKKRLWTISNNRGFAKFTTDGSKVVILLGGWGLWGWEDQRLGVYDLSSGSMTEITPVYDTESFDISPDGKSIVYETKSGLYKEIFTINMDGSEKTKLNENSLGDNSQPVFSPDGLKIAFVASVYGFYNSKKIAVMNSNGTGITYLTNNDYRADVNPHFSPDGDVILFNNTW